MISEGTRVLRSLPLLELRVQATNAAWREHFEWCPIEGCSECLYLADEADLAAAVFGFEKDRQQMAGVR